MRAPPSDLALSLAAYELYGSSAPTYPPWAARALRWRDAARWNESRSRFLFGRVWGDGVLFSEHARRFGRSRNWSLVRDSSLRHCLRRFGPPAPCARRALPAVRRGRYRRWRRVEITKQASKSGYLLYNINNEETRATRSPSMRRSSFDDALATRYTLYDGAMTRCLCVRRSRVDAVGPANCPFCVDFCSACHVSPVFPISRFVPSVRETKVVFGWPPLFGCKGTRSLYAWGRREHGTQARLGIEAFAG